MTTSSASYRFVVYLSTLLFWLLPITTHAQNWTNIGNLPEYPIAYDQNGQRRVAVTRNNVYTSANGGTTWTQRLTAANAPFLSDPLYAQLDDDFCFVFDEVIFIRAEFGTPFFSTVFKVYASSNDGATWKEVFTNTTGTGIPIVNAFTQQMWQADANTFIAKFILSGVPPDFTTRAQFYVSTDNGQNWALVAQELDTDLDFEFSGITPTHYVFHQGNRVVYRNKTNFAVANTITLPADCAAVAVSNNDIRAVAISIPGNTVRAWRSTTGAAPFTAFTQVLAGAPGIAQVQIIGQDVFVGTGSETFFVDELYRLNFGSFNAPVHLSAAPDYAIYYPFRLASDGVMINDRFGVFPHVPNIYSGDGLAFDRPFVTSTNQFTSYTKASKPNYALDAMPLLQGRRVRFAGDIAWNTTDGVNYSKSFDLTSGPQSLRYFSGAAQTSSYSDPSLTYFFTNDALTKEPIFDQYIAEAGNALYTTRFESLLSTDQGGIFRSLNNGETWSKINSGNFWANQTIIGDQATGSLYATAYTSAPNPIAHRMARSTDQGVTWKILTGTNLPVISSAQSQDNPLHPRIAVYNNYIFVKNLTSLQVSTDGGVSFSTVAAPFPLINAEMYITNGRLTIETRDEQLWQRDINLWLGAAGGALATAAQVDMSLTVEMIPPNPPPFSNFDVKYTITNSGPIPATSINLASLIGGDVVAQGGKPTTYVNFSPNFGANILAPGATGSVTFHYFRQNAALPNAWGSLYYFEPDIDSRALATIYPFAIEDDEAFFQAGGVTPCAPDVTPPVLSPCPSNISLTTATTSAIATWTPPTATDNCTPGLTALSTFSPGQTFGLGTTTVTYVARDVAFNETTCAFTVTVTQVANPCSPDITRPVLTSCPSPISLTTTGASAVATWTAPTATDNCPGAVTVTGTSHSGQAFGIGTTTVTYTARDAANNTTACSFAVTVQSATNTCAGNLITNPGFESADFLSGWLFSTGFTPGTTTPGSTYAGLRSFVACGAGQFYQTQPATAGSTYNLSAFVSATAGPSGGKLMYLRFLTSAFIPMSTDFAEITQTTYTQISLAKLAPAGTAWVEIGFFKDAPSTPCFYIDEVCLNTGTVNPCSPDVTRPVLTACPANIALTTTGTSAIATWTAPTATDLCPGAVTVTGTQNSGQVFAVGVTTVTYTARDAANNTTACSFTVTVTQNSNPCSPDVTRPVLTACPANIALTTTGTSAIATWTAPTATDLCPGAVTVTGTQNSGQVFAVGVTTVTYTARDAANNTTACAFTVTVTSGSTTCVGNLITANPGFELQQGGWNTDGVVDVVTDKYAGSHAYSICAPSGNRVYQTFAATAGTNYTFSLFAKVTGGSAGVIYIKYLNSSWTPLAQEFQAFNAISYTQVTQSLTAPTGTAYIEIGALRNTGATGCILLDQACLTTGGSSNPCSPDVTAPTIACPPSQSLQTTGTGIVATWTAPTPSDNCTPPSGLTVTTTNSPGAIFPIGVTTVVYTVRDAASNSATCSFNVSVTQPGTGGADLRVTMTSNRVTVPQWGNFTVTITARNEGTTTIASGGIQIGICDIADATLQPFAQASKVVFAGAPPPPTTGNWNPYQNQIWTFTNLLAGQTATLTIPLFTLGTAQKVVMAHAVTQSPNDPDSQPALTRPANCIAVQDDEASITINAGQALQSSNQVPAQATEQVAHWLLFPNPASQEVFVQVNDQVQAISIIGQMGNTVQRLVADSNLAIETDQNGMLRLDLSQVPTGMYLVRLDVLGKRSVVKKLVVVNE
jgi:hypothetical protein